MSAGKLRGWTGTVDRDMSPLPIRGPPPRPRQPVDLWTVTDVCNLLVRLKLSRLVRTFRQKRIDGPALLRLSVKQLKNMVFVVRERERLMARISLLRRELNALSAPRGARGGKETGQERKGDVLGRYESIQKEHRRRLKKRKSPLIPLLDKEVYISCGNLLIGESGNGEIVWLKPKGTLLSQLTFVVSAVGGREGKIQFVLKHKASGLQVHMQTSLEKGEEQRQLALIDDKDASTSFHARYLPGRSRALFSRSTVPLTLSCSDSAGSWAIVGAQRAGEKVLCASTSRASLLVVSLMHVGLKGRNWSSERRESLGASGNTSEESPDDGDLSGYYDEYESDSECLGDLVLECCDISDNGSSTANEKDSPVSNGTVKQGNSGGKLPKSPSRSRSRREQRYAGLSMRRNTRFDDEWTLADTVRAAAGAGVISGSALLLSSDEEASCDELGYYDDESDTSSEEESGLDDIV